MKLYDPQRPKIYHRPAFFPDGQCIIPHFSIWPLEGGQVELKMMLPLPDNRFSGKYFTLLANYDDLKDLISSFENDPELFIQTHFCNDPTGLLPGINPGKTLPKNSSTSTSANTKITIDDMLTED